MLLVGYGGQVGAVPSGATAVAQRDVVMKAVYYTVWTDESDDAANLTWIREFYRDVYADTGGVPVPNQVSNGSYINYPDNDLADPEWNTSGVPWHTLYYKDNYPRLQQVKAPLGPTQRVPPHTGDPTTYLAQPHRWPGKGTCFLNGFRAASSRRFLGPASGLRG